MLARRNRFFLSVLIFVAFVLQLAERATAADKPFGLDRRVAWTSSRLTGSPDPPAPYAIERVFPKLQFVNPVEFVRVPGSDRILVAELGGRVLAFHNQPDAATFDLACDLRTTHKDLTAIYGFAFHPKFQENHYVYIAYVIGSGIADGSHVARFTMTSVDPPRIDLASEQTIITWLSGGHNGACIQFANDGTLFISTGDGAGPFPPDSLNAGQDMSNLLCAILRIDVDHPEPGKDYSIPKDNPFVDLAGARGEIWSYGFRNPWKMSVDRATGDLWVGDVGWELWEMIYRVERGGNYGWSIMEGPQPVHQERKRGPTPILPPTVAHSHIESRSITGGYVYHGKRQPELQGSYIYGDYETGKLWALRFDGKKVTSPQELVDTTLHIVCFGVDGNDELYVVDYGEKAGLYRLVPNNAASANLAFPKKLSETGLFESVKNHTPAAGVVPYSVNAEPWTDGAVAERYIGIPSIPFGDKNVKAIPSIDDTKTPWVYPNNSVFMKTISIETEPSNVKTKRRLETQLMHYDVDTWRAYAYVWNDDQTDATLADPAGQDRTLEIVDKSTPDGHRKQAWRTASRTECLICHNAYNGGSICGFTPTQLNRDQSYGKVVDSQLRALSHIGLFAAPLPETGPKLVNPYDSHAALGDRARSYLHANCAHCHRSGGGGTALIDVLYEQPLDKTGLLGTRPTQGTFGMHGAEIVAAGDPCRSVLFYRISKVGRGRMPHFGSTVVDDAGVRLMAKWIRGLPVPPAAANKGSQAVQKRHEQLLTELSVVKKSPAEQKQVVDECLSSTSGALLLLTAVADGAFNEPFRGEVIKAGVTHSDVQVRDLFERFVPEDQRVPRLGSVIKPESILSLPGDAVRGKAAYLSNSGVVCKNCHRIGNEGKQIGPELTTIGKKLDRAKILESILEPSKTIDPKFAAWIIESKSGLVHTGVLVEQTAKEVVLKDVADKTIRVAVADVETIAPQQKSLMPELQFRDLTAQQVADLLSYLESLK